MHGVDGSVRKISLSMNAVDGRVYENAIILNRSEIPANVKGNVRSMCYAAAMTWKVRSCISGLWEDDMAGSEHACRNRFRILAEQGIGAVLMDDRGRVISRNVGAVEKVRTSRDARDVPPPVPLDPAVRAAAAGARELPLVRDVNDKRRVRPKARSRRRPSKQVTNWPATVQHRQRPGTRPVKLATEKQVRLLAALHHSLSGREPMVATVREWRKLSRRAASDQISSAIAAERDLAAEVRHRIDDPRA